MRKLSRGDLWGLEEYAERRADFRAEVMVHKRGRRIALGPHATLLFEDALTMKYQVQEMLRVERIFEPAAIEEELDAYNALIPDGQNWKATLLIEYEDPQERARALARMPGVEHRLWFTVDDGARSTVFANDDLDRTERDKTAAVHFLRFELDDAERAAVKRGAPVTIGIDHDELRYERTLTAAETATLAEDLD